MVILTFFGSNCGTSLETQLPTLQQEVYLAYGRDQVEVFSINISINPDLEKLRAYRDEKQITFPILVDGLRTSMEYGVFATPDLILIDKAGTIRHKETSKFFDEETKVVFEPLIAELDAVDIGVQVGYRAPDFTLPLLDGDDEKLNLYEQSAKYDVVVLCFFIVSN